MMKGIILYKTQYGSTAQYAAYLADQLDAALLPFERMEASTLQTYDYYVIGSLVKVGRLKAANWIKFNWDWLKHKKVFLFSVSATPVDSKELKDMMEKSLPPEIMNNLEYFALPGRINPKSLHLLDRLMINLVARAEKNPREKDRLLNGYDDVDKVHLMPLVDAVEGFIAEHQEVSLH